jgi:ribose/xylose/arabinose/galactoside ABC-type transport system permease subunit
MITQHLLGSAWRWLRQQGREFSLLLFLLALWGYLSVVAPAFLQGPNLEDLLVNSAYTAIAAAGMTLVIIAGGIDISVGSMLAVCSVLAGTTAKANWPLPLVILVTILAGLAMGTLNGLLTGYAGIPSIIVTLGTLSIYRGLMTWITKGYWIHGLPASFAWLGTGRVAGLPVPVGVMALVVLAFGVLLSQTAWGRRVYAVGGNPRAARLAGLNVAGTTVAVFALCGALTGVATLTFAPRFAVIQSNAGLGFELLVITAVVVGGTNIFGGRGSIWGSLLGVLLLSTISSALTFLHISVYWERTVQGGLILLAIGADLLRLKRPGGAALERIGEGGTDGLAPARERPRWVEFLRRREVLLLGLLGLSGFAMALLSDKFLTVPNLLDMTRHFVEVGLLALPMTLIIITAGIDLSVGSMVGLCAVILGFAWDRLHLTLGSAAALTLLTGLLAGLGNGLLIAGMGIPALIVTLATMAIYRGLADGISQARRVSDFPESFFFLGQGYVGPFPTQLVLFAFLAALTALVLARTGFGRALYALGSNEETARLSGLQVARLKAGVYALSGLLASLAALVYVSRVSTAKPDAGLGLELDVITAVVLGGTHIAGGEGSILGSVLGLSLLSVLRRGLTLANFPMEGQAVLLGMLLIGAVWLDRLVRR